MNVSFLGTTLQDLQIQGTLVRYPLQQYWLRRNGDGVLTDSSAHIMADSRG